MGSPAPAVLAFIAIMLVILPLPWHYQTKNIATLSLAFWLVQGNLFLAINAIAWMDNVQVKFLPYCNIGSSFQVAGIFGLISASLCTARNLERIASPRASKRNLSDKKREKVFDFFMCIVLPFIYTAFQYIVAPNQINIYEGLGCQLPAFISWPALALYYVPPLIMAITTITYASLTIQWLQLRRSSIGKMLRKSHASMTLWQFIRLMALAILIASFSLGFGIYQLYTGVGGLMPWVSWDNVHHSFSDVGQFPLILMTPGQQAGLWAFWAVQPVSALVFFLLFGPTAQALSDVANAWRWIKKRLGRPTIGGDGRPKGAQTIKSFASMPAAGTTQSNSAPSASERWANGDDLDFDEGDNDSIVSGITKPKAVLKVTEPLRFPAKPEKTSSTSPSAPVAISFPRRSSLLGETIPSPRTPPTPEVSFRQDREASFSAEPPASMALKPIPKQECVQPSPSKNRRNFI